MDIFVKARVAGAKRSPGDILEMLRQRTTKQPLAHHSEWITENNISAIFIADRDGWSFDNDEDAVAFKIKFGL